MKLQMNNESTNNSNSYLSNSLAPLPSFRSLPKLPGDEEIIIDETLSSYEGSLIQIPNLPILPSSESYIADIPIPIASRSPKNRSYSPRHSPRSVRHISPEEVQEIIKESTQIGSNDNVNIVEDEEEDITREADTFFQVPIHYEDESEEEVIVEEIFVPEIETPSLNNQQSSENELSDGTINAIDDLDRLILELNDDTDDTIRSHRVNSDNIKRPNRYSSNVRNRVDQVLNRSSNSTSSLQNIQPMHPISPRDQTPIFSNGQLLNRHDIPSITSPPPVELHPSTSISAPNMIPQYPSSSGRVTEVTRRTPKRKKIDASSISPPERPILMDIRPTSPRDAVPNLSRITSVQSFDYISPSSPEYRLVEEDNNSSSEEKDLDEDMESTEDILISDFDSDEYLDEYQEVLSNPTISRPTKPLPPNPIENVQEQTIPSNQPREDPIQQPITDDKTRRRIVRKRRVKKKDKNVSMPNYRSMSEADKAKWSADFNVKFGILREAYPEFDIPYFDNSTALDVKHQHYDRYVKQIHIDNSVGNYRVYLLVLFAGIELFCVKVLGLDMSGYTINQLRLMNKYDRLLIELGEKTFTSVGSDWPVEARIVVMALFNGIIFLVVRLFASYLGPGLGDMMQNMVNNFLTGDKPEIKSATAEEGVPDPPINNGGGFDLNSIINGLGGLFGGGNNSDKPRRRASRRPAYAE